MTEITNKNTFISEVKKSVDLNEEQFRVLMFVIAEDGYNRIVKKSPVDTGRFRASWNVNLGSIDESVAGAGQNSYQEKPFNLRIPKNPYTVIYISNALPYAWKLEEGGYTNPGQLRPVKGLGSTVLRKKTTPQGYSIQAPQGMVSITLQELESKYRILK